MYEYGRQNYGPESSPTRVNYALQQVAGDYRDDNGMIAKLLTEHFI